MDASQVIFILSAALIIASALMVVTTRNLIHAALWLISTLFGVAVLFVLLEASFLAVVQVVVYIGAIAIMFIFAVRAICSLISMPKRFDMAKSCQCL